MDYTVDWERRRVLPATGNSTCCLHGWLLTVWCADCGLDLEALNDALLTPDVGAPDHYRNG